MSRLIAPSILAADFGRLDEVCSMLDGSRADRIHLDILDGVFAPNISFGFPVCEAISGASHKPLDVHLMIEEPQRYIEKFAEDKSERQQLIDYLENELERLKNIDD